MAQGRLRSGSVPPPSLRAGSLPPGARSGSVTPSTRAGSVLPHHTSPGGIIRHRSATTTVVRGVRGDGTTGVVVGPPRSSHGAASAVRRASISVVPGTATAAARRTTNSQQPIVSYYQTVDTRQRFADVDHASYLTDCQMVFASHCRCCPELR